MKRLAAGARLLSQAIFRLFKTSSVGWKAHTIELTTAWLQFSSLVPRRGARFYSWVNWDAPSSRSWGRTLVMSRLNEHLQRTGPPSSDDLFSSLVERGSNPALWAQSRAICRNTILAEQRTIEQKFSVCPSLTYTGIFSIQDVNWKFFPLPISVRQTAHVCDRNIYISFLKKTRNFGCFET